MEIVAAENAGKGKDLSDYINMTDEYVPAELGKTLTFEIPSIYYDYIW